MLAVRSCGEFHGKLMRGDFNNRGSRVGPVATFEPPLTHRWTIVAARGEHRFEIRVVEIEKIIITKKKMANLLLDAF